MVGRAGELAELDRAWATLAADGRRGPVVAVLTGAAGIGKSLLVAAALEAFRPRPAVLLSGAARLHSPAPYDWLAAVLSGRDTSGLDLPPDALAWLAQQPTAPRERYAPGTLLRLAVRTVRLLVGVGPAVLVVEHLHALDPASLNLLGELAAARDLPALLLVASRPAVDAVAPDLAARVLSRLCGVRGAVRQHLGPLGPAEVAEVLAQVYAGSRPSRRLVDGVWQRTGGNPYRTARRARRTGAGRAAAPAAAGAPARPGAPAGAHAPARRRADRPGDRGARLPGRGDVQQAGRPGARHLGADGHRARVEPAAQDRVGVAYGGGAVGGAAPAAGAAGLRQGRFTLTGRAETGSVHPDRRG
ncbi:hypothetical protein GCM10010429_50900 [Micromonospora olivasterospora]